VQVRVRAYDPQDSSAIIRLSLRAWAPVFASLERAMGPEIYRVLVADWRRTQAEAVAAVCADPHKHVWVAEQDGGPVGFIAVVLRREDNLGEIYMVAVDPDHQQQGIGTALIEHALGWIRDAGMRLAMVETGYDPGHAPARRTYQRAGFRVLPVARFFKKL
jgi:GNAT superfamily N-acetyltransferase